MMLNTLNLGSKISIQINEVQKFPNRLNLKRSTLRHITIKLLKDKERILKPSRGKQLIIKGKFHQAISSRKFADLRKCNDIFIVPKEKKQTNTYRHGHNTDKQVIPKLSFKNEEINTLSDKQKVRQLVTTRSAL